MKLKKLTLKNYKKFKNKTIDFTDKKGKMMDFVVLVGNNSIGKSSVLQAIAAILGTATQRLKSPEELEWEGFNYDLICKFKPKPTEIDLEVAFSETEIKATQMYYQQLVELKKLENTLLPSENDNILLGLVDYKKRIVGCQTAANYFQFRGYHYAKQLFDYTEKPNTLYDKVGNIFWYSEQRTSWSVTSFENEVSRLDIENLRKKLISWEFFDQKMQKKGFQLREGQRNHYQDLSKIYHTFFPEHEFVGAVPESNQDNYLNISDWFYIENKEQGLQYELSEMSAGERALFPLIMDFANWNINNSIVLIDEAELHLHPPLQQTLIETLPKLGKNNQFIITTHSNFITSLVEPEQIIRL